MKKFIIVIAMLLCYSVSQAQVKVYEKLQGGNEMIVDINSLKNLKVIQIVGTANWTGTKVTIMIDYGQKKDWKSDSFIVDNKTGAKTKFHSVIAAINYLENNGWAYLDAYTVSIGNSNVYHYTFKRIDVKP